jgi:tetratricopeptide (TPR) repeat protein
MGKADIISLFEILAERTISNGYPTPMSSSEMDTRWAFLRSKYPEVIDLSRNDLNGLHRPTGATPYDGSDLENDLSTKWKAYAYLAANFDCRDRPNDPHPFVARGRLFTVLGEWDKAEADFAKAWQLGGTGWVKSEARRLGRDALNEAKYDGANRQDLEGALRKAEIANKYLLPIGPHRWARVFARHRLGLPLDAADQATLSWLLCGLPVAG